MPLPLRGRVGCNGGLPWLLRLTLAVVAVAVLLRSAGWLAGLDERAPGNRVYSFAFVNAADAMHRARARFGGEWWVAEDTLVGALRYGAVRHKMPSGHMDETAAGITVMFGVSSDAQWAEVREFLEWDLRRRGDWGWCSTGYTDPGFDSGLDEFRCQFGGWLVPTFPMPAGSLTLRVRRYMRPDAPESHLDKGFAWTHRTPHAGGVDGAEQVQATSGVTYGGYPFQAWGGMLPLRMVYPLARCRMFANAVPCPRQAVAVLGSWNNGQYAGGAGSSDSSGRCMAYADGLAAGADGAVVRRFAQVLHAAGYQSFIQELAKPRCLAMLGASSNAVEPGGAPDRALATNGTAVRTPDAVAPVVAPSSTSPIVGASAPVHGAASRTGPVQAQGESVQVA